MSADKPFFDTNVLLYLLAADQKADKAEALLVGGGVISVQVLNEFASVATRKLKMPWEDIREILTTIRKICTVIPLTLEVHDAGLDIAEKYGLSLYDSLIVAAGVREDCTVLYSEDMQDGQIIEAVTIRNPFTI
ncbi:VapC toxin family PIN domain ribonuclease [Verrucomicrobia bacterium LW23]|nr:VapC toxin family PIN domain ribonuclease [Verrucomicrobia bacterium LW23]